WCPTPGPVRPRAGDSAVVVSHRAGLTRFSRTTRGLSHELEVFVHADAHVKFSLLTIRNDGPETRRLSVIGYNDWWLGPPRDGHQMHVVTEYLPEQGAVLARNAFAEDFRERVAFVCVSETPHSATGDRLAFLGRNGTPRAPIGLESASLSGEFGAG